MEKKGHWRKFLTARVFSATSAAWTAQRTTEAPRAFRLVNTVLSQQPDFLDFFFPLPHRNNNKNITSVYLPVHG